MKISKKKAKVTSSEALVVEQEALEPANIEEPVVDEVVDPYMEAKTNISLAIDALASCDHEDFKAREAIANLSIILVDLS